MNFIASNYHRFAENLIIIRATHLCHCERSVAISRKGYLIPLSPLIPDLSC